MPTPRGERAYARTWVPGTDDEPAEMSAPDRGQPGRDLDEMGRLWRTDQSSRSPAGLRLTEDLSLIHI